METAQFAGGVIRSGSSQEINYFITDHLGSVRSIVNSAGTTVEQNDYYAFGAKHVRSNYVKNDNRLDYNGKEEQTTGNLKYLDYGARMYDNTIGRWFNTDPLAEIYYSQSPYHFSGNNPVNLIDRNGMNYSYSGGQYFRPDGSVAEWDEVYDWIQQPENSTVIYKRPPPMYERVMPLPEFEFDFGGPSRLDDAIILERMFDMAAKENNIADWRILLDTYNGLVGSVNSAASLQVLVAKKLSGDEIKWLKTAKNITQGLGILTATTDAFLTYDAIKNNKPALDHGINASIGALSLMGTGGSVVGFVLANYYRAVKFVHDDIITPINTHWKEMYINMMNTATGGYW